MRKLLLAIAVAGMANGAPINVLYQQKCANCHGIKGETTAMGKSSRIKELSAAKIEKALYEYASGTRAAMPIVKIMKKNFIEANSKEQVRALAEYITTL